MELSRKVVTKHWWKLSGLAIAVLLLTFAGVLALVFGVFVTSPLVLATLMYAYEDIFGGITPAANPQPLGTGPSGTVVLPGRPPMTSRFPGGDWTLATRIGLAAFVLAMGVLALMSLSHRNRHFDVPPAPEVASSEADSAPQAEPVEKISPSVFGPVIERELQARQAGTNQFLDLDAERLLTPSHEITDALADSPGGNFARALHSIKEDRFWQGLDIPKDSRRFQYISWLRESGADLMFAGNGAIIGFDGIFRAAHGDNSTNWDNWDSLTPEQTRAAVELNDWEKRAAEASAQGQPLPPTTSTDGPSPSSAMHFDSHEPGGPIVNFLTRDQSVNWFFKTREGRMGVLQIVGFTDNPSSVKIRYKLIQQTTGHETNPDTAMSPQARGLTREALNERLEAASNMSDAMEKDKPLAGVATDAAKAGEVEIVISSLGQMHDQMKRDETTREAARLLAKHGLRKRAIELAKGIGDGVIRDQTLSELAE